MPIEVIIVDFGSQYTQLILHKLLYKLNIDVELIDYLTFEKIYKSDLKKNYPNLKSIILSGGPQSVNETSPNLELHFLEDYTILGICYGAQLIAYNYGCKLNNEKQSEFGSTLINTKISHRLFDNIPQSHDVFMSHNDSIEDISEKIEIISDTENNIPAIWNVKKSKNLIIGFQFHPEVEDTMYGINLLKNFLDLSNVFLNNTKNNLLDNLSNQIIQKVQGENVILAFSGGVDSSTLALLLTHSINNQMRAILIDNGLMRKDEITNIVESFKNTPLKDTIIVSNSQDIFIQRLRGIEDPEQKRKIIGKTFIDVLNIEAKKLEDTTDFKNIKYLAQGTIYPDVIESGKIAGSKVIKSHHNVGGLPEDLPFELLEPLKYLFKDDVRKIAKMLNLPDMITNRHPFPGPGLAIRICGEITKERLDILRECDYILMEELKNTGYYENIWQAAAILLPIKTVGVMGDCRTYQHVVALRLVNSVNGMTANVARLPVDVLCAIANKITNNVKGVNRVVYDLSSKPPATIEWE